MMSSQMMVDLVIGVLVVEAIALYAFGRRRFKLPRFRTLLPNLAAGLFLALALRAAIRDGGVASIALFLALAGIAHAVDLWIRRTP